MAIFRVFAKSVVPYFVILVVVDLLFTASQTMAFIGSEDEQFQADITEAKKRAKDFKNTLQRIEDDQKKLESAGREIGPKREAEAKLQEKSREQYVEERNNRPLQELIIEKLEREDLRLKKLADEEMDQNRKNYVKKRDQVRRVLEREAYIDESKEYGL